MEIHWWGFSSNVSTSDEEHFPMTMTSKSAKQPAETPGNAAQDNRFRPGAIEAKWRATWAKEGLGTTADHAQGHDNYYSLAMLPYPSGDLHIGHWYNYTGHDAFSKYMRMRGFNVMQPIGFDAFGLPAENAAIKRNIQPRDWTLSNIATMREQLKLMGATWDWSREIVSCLPDYYKWSEWLFLQFYKAGLAYRTKAPANWCPTCNTTLANEQVVNGKCERCGTPVIRKEIDQWLFRITKYADELLNFDGLDWPEKTVTMQRNWIGRSEGAEVRFTAQVKRPGRKTRPVAGGQAAEDRNVRPTGENSPTGQSNATADGYDTVEIPVFTTRPDTIFGVTFFVLAPEHPLVERITTPGRKKAVRAYVDAARHATEIERQSTDRPKTGVFTGGYVTNPISGAQVPVWVADYVLMSYGHGAVMGVPAHDARDFAFARQYGLSIVEVICPDGVEPSDPATWTEAHEAVGRMVNSGPFDGTPASEAKRAIIAELERRGVGQATVNYRLRDWLISRQRFWGAPIPVVYCPDHGTVPVPEDHLPVLLPDHVDFKPTGESPLKYVPEFYETTCPICGKPATRETDTMDTFICSSWYFLRYCDPHNAQAAWSPEKIANWMPVDMYNGGPEHAVMHLLYARFFIKALRDMGLVNFSEPFTRLFHQGMVLGPDGQKMSKSRGNVIAPDKVVNKYGADAVRCYLMFMGPFDQGGPWNNQGIEGVARYMQRVWSLVTTAPPTEGGTRNDAKATRKDAENETASRVMSRTSHATPRSGSSEPSSVGVGPASELARLRHKTIKRVGEHYANLRFNTALAALMEMTNALNAARESGAAAQHPADFAAAIDTLILLLAPLAPYITEELWHQRGHTGSVHRASWPEYDEALTLDAIITVPVQVNGKLRATIEVPADADEGDIRAAAEAEPKVQAHIAGKTIRKVVYVPGKLINFVVG
jgi:leucyl-tRNA synthetase